MAQFVSQRDVDFFDGLNSELIDSILDTIIYVFKVSLHDSEVNLSKYSLIVFPLYPQQITNSLIPCRE